MDTEKVRVLREKDAEIGRLQQQVQQLQVSSVWDMDILFILKVYTQSIRSISKLRQ